MSKIKYTKEKALSIYNTVTAGSKKEKHCQIVRFHLNTRLEDILILMSIILIIILFKVATMKIYYFSRFKSMITSIVELLISYLTYA